MKKIIIYHSVATGKVGIVEMNERTYSLLKRSTIWEIDAVKTVMSKTARITVKA
jgi:hypothetical protein